MIKISNIVASDEIKFKFSFHEFVECENVEYNPEIFPGAFIRFNEPKCSVTIFKSGKMNIVGCRNIENIEDVSRQTKKILKKYKKEDKI